MPLGPCLFLALSLFLTSCVKDSEPRIRLVDVRGKPSSLVPVLPEQNAVLLAQQQSYYNPATEGGAANKMLPPPQAQRSSAVQSGNKYATDASIAQSNATSAPIIQNPQVREMNLGPDGKAIPITAGSEMKPHGTKVTSIKPAKTSASAKSARTTAAKATRGIFVQAGSFTARSRAQTALTSAERIVPGAKGRIEQIKIAQTMNYRVLVGPFSTNQGAKNAVTKLSNAGVKSMIVIKK